MLFTLSKLLLYPEGGATIGPIYLREKAAGPGFMKLCAVLLLRLDFVTSAGNKMHSLVRKSSFSKAQWFHETMELMRDDPV